VTEFDEHVPNSDKTVHRRPGEVWYIYGPAVRADLFLSLSLFEIQLTSAIFRSIGLVWKRELTYEFVRFESKDCACICSGLIGS